MSKKISRGLTFLALAILSLGAIFFVPSLFSGTRAVQASAEEKFESTDEKPLWVEKELNEAKIEDATYFGLDCKVIDSADDLAYFSYQVGQAVDEYVNANIYLADDIDLSAGLWTPIGTTSNPFKGNFFGNGHSISNIVVAQASQFRGNAVGLFGAVKNGSIVDLTVSGGFAVSSMIDETNNVGTLVGHLDGSAKVINCFDETYQPTNSTYSTIGTAKNGTFVIYPSSKNGKEVYLTTAEEMSGAITIENDLSTKGYTAFYNTAITPSVSDLEGTGVGFYKDGKYFFSGNKTDSQQVRVAFTDTTYTSTLAGFSHVLYASSAPVLRENATVGGVYALRTGYQATIGTPLVAESGVVNLTWEEKFVNVTYDFDYSTRDVSFNVGYDTPWENIIADHPIERLGYQTRTLYSNADKTEELNTSEQSQFLTYYADNADVVYMTWSDAKTLTSKLYFAAASTEGGAYTNAKGSDAVSAVQVTGATHTAMSTGDDYDLSAIPAGGPITVNFTLNDGFIFQGAGEGSHVTSRSDWTITADVSDLNAGAYAYFPNSTGEGLNYKVGNTGGYYDAYTPVAVKVEANGANYTITFTNILDNGGELVLVFGKESQTINLKGTGLEFAEASLSDNSSQTVLDWEKKTLTTKAGEKFTLTVTRTNEDYYILTYKTSGFEFNEVDSNSTVELNGETYYKNRIFKINSFKALPTEELSITLTINRLVTFIKVQIDYGKDIEQGYQGVVPVYIISSNKEEQATYTGGVFEVSNATETTIRLGKPEQAFFSLERVSGVENVQIQNNSFSYIFENTTASSDDPAYTITIYPAKIAYDVSISYTLDGQPIDEEVAKRFVDFSGITTSLDYALAGGYSYSLALTQGAQTWLDYGVSVTLSNAGSEKPGMSKPSSIQGATNGTLNGTFGSGNNFEFTYLPGTIDSTITVALTTKTINVYFKGLVLNSGDKKTPFTTTNYASLSLKYSANELGTLTISQGGFTSVPIENGYYLVGWYLSNGTVVKTFSNAELLANDEFKSLVASSAKGDQSAPTVTINPLVEKRVINLSYSAGGQGASDGVSEDESVAQSYSYGDPAVALSITKYKKIGYSFSGWTATKGTTNDNQYRLVGANWDNFWASGSSTSVWESFVTTAESDPRAERGVVLTPNFSILTYKIAVDSDRTLNISLGQSVTFTKAGNNTYAIYSVGSNNVNGATKTGHEVTGYTIKGQEGSEQTGQTTTFTLTLDNIKTYISKNNLYSVSASDGAHFVITSEFTAMVLKLYITTNADDYYAVDLSDSMPEGAGGTDGTGTYVNINYGQLPSKVLSYVTVTRPGFTRTGYTIGGIDFDTDSAYTQTTNATLMPKFAVNEEDEFWSSYVNVKYSEDFEIENKQTHNKYEFYLTFPGSGEVDEIELMSIIFNHNIGSGLSISLTKKIYIKGYSQVFENVVPQDGSPKIKTGTVFNLILELLLQGVIQEALSDITLVCEYTIEDYVTSETMTKAVETKPFKVLQNEMLVSIRDSVDSYYTGTENIVLTTEEISSTLTTTMKYDAHGDTSPISQQMPATAEMMQGSKIIDEAQTFAVSDTSYDAKILFESNRLTAWGDMDEETFRKVMSFSFPGCEIEIIEGTAYLYFTCESAVKVVKAPAVIRFNSTGAAYISGMVMTVAQSGSGSFNVLDNTSYPFTYSFDNITLVEREFDSLPQTFTGTENAVTDQGVFNISNLVIQKNGQGENLLANFDWSISTESSFTVFDSSNFKEYRYETRYFTANEDGSALAGIQNAWNGNQVHNFTVSNIMVNGSSVSPNNGGSFTAQYNHFVKGQILFSIYGNGESALVISVNPETVTSLSMNITVNANASANVSGLVLYNWQTDTTVNESLFGNVTAGPMTKLDYGTSQAQTTYAVFTDVTKVLVDFNLSGLKNETLYVASDDNFTINDPTDSEKELAFDGFVSSGNGAQITDNEGNSSVTCTTAGGSATFKAKWRLTNVNIELDETKLTITTIRQKAGVEIYFNDLLNNLSKRFIFGNASYADKIKVVATKTSGKGAETSPLTLNVFNTNYFDLPYYEMLGSISGGQHCYLSLDNSGTYKLKVTYSYNDGIQTTTVTKDYEFSISMVMGEIRVGNIAEANKDLVFANSDFQEITLPCTLYVTQDDLTKPSEIVSNLSLSADEIKKYVVFNGSSDLSSISDIMYFDVTTPQGVDGDILDSFYRAGEYIFEAKVPEKFAKYVKAVNPENEEEAKFTIAKYTIDLDNFADQITVGKPAGTDDPDPITSTITIAGANNDQVAIYFDRDRSGTEPDALDRYRLSLKNDSATYFNGLSEEDAENYTIDPSFELYFTVFANTGGSLILTIPNGLHHTYTGNAVTTFELVYEEGQLLIRVRGTQSSAEVQAQISIDGGRYDVAESFKQTIANNVTIVFDGTSSATDYNESGYALTIGETGSVGYDTVTLENGRFYIDKAPITLTEVSKTFDKTTAFTSAANFTGALNSDLLKITGNFASEHAGSQALENLAITGDNSNNYYIANTDFMGTINAKTVAEATVSLITNSSIVYGQIKEGMRLEELLAILGSIQISIDGETVTLVNGQSDYLSISGFAIEGASYSSSDSLVANSTAYTINFVLASTDYTGMNGTDGTGASGQITIKAKVLDLFGTTISKGYDGTTDLPADIVWQGFDIESGDDVSIDMVRSVYAESGKGTHDITIVLAGDDSANYSVTDNVTGQITAITITLEVNVIENLPEDGFVDGNQTITNGNLQIKVSYPFDEGANVDEIISSWAKPSRVGYTVTGYSYKETGGTFTTITDKNLGDWLEAIATDSANTDKTATIYPNWQIDSITITITGKNLASISAEPSDKVNIVDGNFADDSASVTVDYYSSFNLTLTTKNGYKITGVIIGNNVQSEGLGKNSFTASFTKLGASTSIQVTTSSIVVTFNFDKNIPTVEGALITETSSTGSSVTVNYAGLNAETLDSILPNITLTEGTFTLSGWKNGEVDLTLSETIKAYIDSLFTTLDADKSVNLTAQWKGVEYTITFDGGELQIGEELVEGTIEGTESIKATFGQAIATAFPTAKLGDTNGYVYNFFDAKSDGKMYTQGTILSSIRADGQLTLYAVWSEGRYQVTFKIDPLLTVRFDGNNLTDGSKEIVHGEKWEFEITAAAGYSFTVEVKDFYGQHSALTKSPFSIWNVYKNSTIEFVAVANDNTLTLSYNSKHISVTVDDTAYTSAVTRKTGTTATVVATASEGYEFDSNSAVLSGSGTISGLSLSENNKVLTFTWKDFTDDGTITITELRAKVTLSWGVISNYARDISIGGESQTLDNGSFITRAGEELDIEIILKYGFKNAKLTSENATISNEKNADLNAEDVVVYTATISGFTKDFKIILSAEVRTFTVTVSASGISPTEGEHTVTVTPSGENNLVFGSSVTLSASPADPSYRFIGWYHDEELVSEEAKLDITASEENKALLESGNLNFEAKFDYNTVDVTFNSGAHGSMSVKINEEEPFAVGAGSTLERTIFVGDRITFTFQPDKGYEIDMFYADSEDNNLTDGIKEGVYTIDSVVANSYTSYTISYKASEVYVDISVSVRIHFVDYPNNNLGGNIWLVDASGTKLEDENYLPPSEGDKVVGSRYKVLTYTDQVFYLYPEAKAGYSFSFSAQTNATIDAISLSDGRTIYRISNATDGSSLVGVFTAEDVQVDVMFVSEQKATDQETTTLTPASAGRIQITDSKGFYSEIGNEQGKLSISAVTSTDLTLTVYTNFYFTLAVKDEESSEIIAYIDGEQEGFSYTLGKAIKLSDEETKRMGFTYSSTLTLTNINSDITVKILVEPQEFKVKLYVNENDETIYASEPIVIDGVLYGEVLDLTNLTDEEKERITNATEDSEYFLGYYTKQLGAGEKYIDENLIAIKPWEEKPYKLNGQEYVVADNYDPETHTFTLYAGWAYKKAIVSVDFIPPELKEVGDYSISDIITNINQTVPWINPDNIWIGEFKVTNSLNLSLSAFEFEGYEFAYWSVTSGEQTVQYTSKNLTLSNMDIGEYAIQAVYLPTFSITIQSDSQEDVSLIGEVYITQDGQRVTTTGYDSTKEVVLVAEEKPGYSFQYWINANGEIYYASEVSEGRWEFSLGPQSKPISLSAVFKGDEVDLVFDLSDFAYGQIISAKIGGRQISDFSVQHDVTIGEKIELQVEINTGYGVKFAGPAFNYDPALNTYSYIAKAQDLVDGKIIIKPVSTQLEISFKFEFKVGGEDKIDDATITGSTRFTYTLNNEISANTPVTDGMIIEENLLFGGTATLTIVPSLNYTVGNILIYSSDSNVEDITHMLNNGIINISNAILSEHFAENAPYTIVINYVRMMWNDEAYRASDLQGEGTQSNPYIISTPAEMGFVAWAVNNGEVNDNDVAYAECYYKLTANLDFNGKFWQPIGTHDNPFNGTMDLGEHSISNVNLAENFTNPNPTYNKLFWVLGDKAVIIQANHVLAIVLGIVGGLLLLAIIIIVTFVIIRKKKKKKYNELANG